MNRTRGFTLIELLTVMAIIALLVGLLLPALAQARAKAQMTKDQTQIKQIHAAFATFGRDYDGIFPTPGLINRLAVVAPGTPLHGLEKPGRGPEDAQANISAAMYSSCVMQNYFTPQILVAPTEPSGFVAVKDDYDWSVYNPLEDCYWDFQPTAPDTPCPNSTMGGAYVPFATKVDKEVHPISDLICNTSYAHMPIAGARKVNQWKDTVDSKFAVLGNRGVRCGNDEDEDVYFDSSTLEFHGGRKQWVGNIGFNDIRVELVDTFYPEGLNYVDDTGQGAVTIPDNLFRNDQEDGNCMSGLGSDIFLTLTFSIDDPEGVQITTEFD